VDSEKNKKLNHIRKFIHLHNTDDGGQTIREDLKYI